MVEISKILFYYDDFSEVNLYPNGFLVFTRNEEAYGEKYVTTAILKVYKNNERIIVESNDRDRVITPAKRKAIGKAIVSKLDSVGLGHKFIDLKEKDTAAKLYMSIEKGGLK